MMEGLRLACLTEMGKLRVRMDTEKDPEYREMLRDELVLKGIVLRDLNNKLGVVKDPALNWLDSSLGGNK